MRILRSTDFSTMSKIAIQYVVDLSKDIELDIVLLHVLATSTSSRGRIGTKKLGQAEKQIIIAL